MNIQLTPRQIRTIVFALFLAAEWEDSIVDANRIKNSSGKNFDSVFIRKTKSNIARFNNLRKHLTKFIPQ